MKRRLFILSIIAILTISTGCSSLPAQETTHPPAPTPTPVPTPVPAPTPADLEQQEIISFTRDMLHIEAKRNELNAYWELWLPKSRYGPAGRWFMGTHYLDGVSQDDFEKYAVPLVEVEGMKSLRKRVLFLDYPQSMQPIKDTFNYIYSSEVELAEREFQQGEEYYTGLPFDRGLSFWGKALVLPEVNQHNIEFWQEKQVWDVSSFLNHPWVKLQLLRRDAYTSWAEILRQHGIDPAKEGFAELVGLPFSLQAATNLQSTEQSLPLFQRLFRQWNPFQLSRG